MKNLAWIAGTAIVVLAFVAVVLRADWSHSDKGPPNLK
jgi:hypothetical protein